jgi:dTDP-4-amino-4,6-dideoxygalactose transaminase
MSERTGRGAPVLMNDFRAEPQELILEEIAACERVIRSGWYILGDGVETFEREWARKCGSSHAVGVGNGMDAIEISLRAMDIGPGDEVITTTTSAFATVLAILRAGATPVLADISKDDALLDFQSVERCITAKTKAVVLVHLYGRVPDMDAWLNLCNEHKLILIEDCAQAHLASWKGKKVGTFGKCGAFSFYPTKNLAAFGDAGALTTESEEIADRARRLRNYGQSDRYHHPELGLNSRLDEMQAAILAVRLKWLDRFVHHRREIADRYQQEIKNPKIELLAQPASAENHVYHLFVIRSAERDRLTEHLRAHDIQTLIHYPLPIHQQPSARELQIDPQGLRNAEMHATRCLSVPCHPQMDDGAVNRVIEGLNSFN